MSNTKLSIIEETIYSDGSGSAGLYEVYGVRISGISTGRGGRVTVTPIGVRTGRSGGREKAIVRSACRMVEQRLESL